jgi:hypothetical protein
MQTTLASLAITTLIVRMTRLGEFAPIVPLFTSASFFNYVQEQNDFWAVFPRYKICGENEKINKIEMTRVCSPPRETSF